MQLPMQLHAAAGAVRGYCARLEHFRCSSRWVVTSLRKRLDRANWIGVDWGTTHLRAWHLAPAGQVLAAARSPDGAASLSKSDFEPALLALCGSWLDQALKTQVIICGWLVPPADGRKCTTWRCLAGHLTAAEMIHQT